MDSPPPSPVRYLLAGAGLALVVLLVAFSLLPQSLVPGRAARPAPRAAAPKAAASEVATVVRNTVDSAKLRQECMACHPFPEPSVLPKHRWRDVIWNMYSLLGDLRGLDPAAVIRWYEERAPERIELLPLPSREGGPAFEARDLAGPPGIAGPAASAHVAWADLLGDPRLELIVCDMRGGWVAVSQPGRGDEALRVVARIPHPAHARAADLDGDGLMDLLVGNLGSFGPGDHDDGSVVWLRQQADHSFETITLLAELGRVVDVEAGDLDGDGDLDIAIAEFGSKLTGGIHVLENKGALPGARPTFEHRLLDRRAGAIHVPLRDLDGDGDLDLVAVFAQEMEGLVAYWNEGALRFDRRLISRARHPVWGYTGLSLADLDGDGDADLVATNGDGFDSGGVLQPFHGLQLFENRGDRSFAVRATLPLPGAHSAKAVDLDGDGDLDLVASAFQPFVNEEHRSDLVLTSVAMFTQIRPWSFEARSLSTDELRYPSLDAADFDGDGDVDLALAVFVGRPMDEAPGSQDQGFWNNEEAATPRATVAVRILEGLGSGQQGKRGSLLGGSPSLTPPAD